MNQKIKQNYKVSLHNHSRFSDGELSIDEIIRKAFENNYDIIAVSDHDNDRAFRLLESISTVKTENNEESIKESNLEKIISNKKTFSNQTSSRKNNYYSYEIEKLHTSYTDSFQTFIQYYREEYLKNFEYDIQKINNYTLKIIPSKLQSSGELYSQKEDLNEEHPNERNPNEERCLYFLKAVENTAIENDRKYHLLLIGYQGKKPNSNLSINEILEESKIKNTIVVAAHPSIYIKEYGGLGKKNLQKYKEYIDALEINGNLKNSFLKKIMNSLTYKWAKKYDFPLIANSDSHIKETYFNNHYYTIINSEYFQEDNIKEWLLFSLKNRKYKIVE